MIETIKKNTKIPQKREKCTIEMHVFYLLFGSHSSSHDCFGTLSKVQQDKGGCDFWKFNQTKTDNIWAPFVKVKFSFNWQITELFAYNELISFNENQSPDMIKSLVRWIWLAILKNVKLSKLRHRTHSSEKSLFLQHLNYESFFVCFVFVAIFVCQVSRNIAKSDVK